MRKDNKKTPVFEGFDKTPSVINDATPSLMPPYADGGCILDCTNQDVMNSMKDKYQSENVEGFQNKRVHKKGLFGGMFSSFSEAFQDAESDTGTPDWNAADDTSTEPVKASKSMSMKKVNRALKLGIDKCEFEVVYDTTNTDSAGITTDVNDKVGYFTAIFTKDPTGCSFIPNQVTKTEAAIIPTISESRASNVSFSF